MPVGREFRIQMGYPNTEKLKRYYGAKDIVNVDWKLVDLYTKRAKNIFETLNESVHESIRWENMLDFDLQIDATYMAMRTNDIFLKLNNHGRKREDVYYNWLRGYGACVFFAKALSVVFGVPQEAIRPIGGDQLTDPRAFSKSPVADLELCLDEGIVRLEIQTGFLGANDIKQHKIREAKRVWLADGIRTYAVHFDLYNGQAAIVDISSVADDCVHWEKRQQFENQVVLAIPERAFRWQLTEKPEDYRKIVVAM